MDNKGWNEETTQKDTRGDVKKLMSSKLGIKSYQPKSILNVQKHIDGGWFWVKYSAFPYLGCQYGCEYCYWRDEKYNPHKPSRDPEVLEFEDAFSQYIKIKENAAELLHKELSKKPKNLIYLDHYQPIEAKERLTREMLKVCLDLDFPVFINEKSPLGPISAYSTYGHGEE